MINLVSACYTHLVADDNDMRYGLTALEEDAKESTKAWEIVNEITTFGVSQRQIFLIIKRLALNLENRDQMRVISKVVDEVMEADPNLFEQDDEARAGLLFPDES